MVETVDQLGVPQRTIARLRAGPLASHVDGFATSLADQGYRQSSVQLKLRAIGRLGQWLAERAVGANDLDEALIVEFIHRPRRRRRRYSADGAAATSLLQYLRRTGVARPQAPVPDRRKLSAIEQDYERYLVRERGLDPRTVRYHLYHVHRLLVDSLGPGNCCVEELSYEDITRYIVRHAPAYRPRSAQCWISVLRCFVRYLHLCGRSRVNLTGSVLRTATWNLAVLPKHLSVEQIEQLLRVPDRDTAVGLRDYALLLLLARLGLRAGEIVKMELEDIDWPAGELTVRGKGSRWNRLPIPQDVGEALVAYLRYARPACAARNVFVTNVAPRYPFRSGGSVTRLVAGYLDRAGIDTPTRGAHVLRHSLATRMLGAGSSLEEIAQVLRHQHLNTTEIYAKVNLNALRSIAQPWPGAAA